MKVAPLIAAAFILRITIPGPIKAKKKTCKGKDGSRYEVGQGYEHNEGETCIRYVCVKNKKKVFMKNKGKCNVPAPDMATNVTAIEASIKFLNASMESMDNKFEAFQTSVESILESITAMESRSKNVETCLSDVNSCPSSDNGTTSVSDVIMKNEDAIHKLDPCSSLCTSPEGCSLVKNTLLTTLPKLGKEFFISFEYKATAYSGAWQNVIHLTEDGNDGAVGTRIPGVFIFEGGRLQISSSINGHADYYKQTEVQPVGEWHQLEFSQRTENGKYIYRVYVNGKIVLGMENSDPRVFSNVKVYASNPWLSSLDGSIRNLFINTEAPNKCRDAKYASHNYGPGCPEPESKIYCLSECSIAADSLEYTGEANEIDDANAPNGCLVGHPVDGWTNTYFNKNEGSTGKEKYRSICRRMPTNAKYASHNNGPGCPDPETKIHCLSECSIAAATLGYTGVANEIDDVRAPNGCLVGHPVDGWTNTYFNKNEGSTGKEKYRSICLQLPTS